MKHKIVLFAMEEEALRNYAKQIEEFFEGLVEVEAIQVLEENRAEIEQIPDADLYVASTADVMPTGLDILKGKLNTVYISRTFPKEKTVFLTHLPDGATVLFFDYSDILAVETLAILNNINKNLKYIYCASKEDLLKYSDAAAVVVIKDNYPEMAGSDKEINLGWYEISPDTYVEIAQCLNILGEKINEKIYRYSQKVHIINPGIFEMITGKWALEDVWNAVVDMIPEGIALIDKVGHILRCNHYIKSKGLSYREENLDVIHPKIKALLQVPQDIKNEVVDIDESGLTFLVSSREIITFGEDKGRLLLLRDAKEVSSAEQTLRVQQRKRFFPAKYRFSDIITQNVDMEKLIETSKRIAKTDISVLITGDSGTGKELLAQSIHNASSRARMPFVAMNCAAIPAHLLESELFGYEEGAFTGARRGGKKGLLELAHRGTIFFDEVEEMPLSVQTKLLRVLQEREIMHVGGEILIPINVRVLAASNENFEELIEEKRFRKDLYYRLCAVQLEIPSLAERREDIPLLAQHFLQKMSQQIMSCQLLEYMKALPWKGNVRELRNCMEYMTALGEYELTVDDLPVNQKKMRYRTQATEKELILGVLSEEEEAAAKEIMKILEIRNLGRRSLTTLLNKRGIQISEYKLRKLLDFLRDQDLIQIKEGRSGIELK